MIIGLIEVKQQQIIVVYIYIYIYNVYNMYVCVMVRFRLRGCCQPRFSVTLVDFLPRAFCVVFVVALHFVTGLQGPSPSNCLGVAPLLRLAPPLVACCF